MAGKNRRSSADLKTGRGADIMDDLLSNGSAYAYFQAIRLLRRQEPPPTGADDSIRVRPPLTLGFPAADIDKIEAVEDEEKTRYHVTANFMGLYGTSSPLPTFYTEDLIEEAREDESVSRDFIDIIHHRLYGLLFNCLLKYRQFFQTAEAQNDHYLERLYCLLGLGNPDLRKGIPDAVRLIRYAGLFTQFPRSATGLTTLLTDAVPDVPIGLEPCIKHMAKIPVAQRLNMGTSGATLGEDTFVGEEIEDRMGRFRIQIGPMIQADFLRFTPGNEGYEKVTVLTGLYITEPLEYEIELILAPNQAQTVSLGDAVRSVLGVTTWVFSEESLGEVRTSFIVKRP